MNMATQLAFDCFANKAKHSLCAAIIHPLSHTHICIYFFTPLTHTATHSMLFSISLFCPLKQNKGEEAKENKNERKNRWQLFFEGGFSFCMVHDFELYLLDQFPPPHGMVALVDFFFFTITLFGNLCGVATFVTHSLSPHRFFAGQRWRRTKRTGDFLCRLVHYVELVFAWTLIGMAQS